MSKRYGITMEQYMNFTFIELILSNSFILTRRGNRRRKSLRFMTVTQLTKCLVFQRGRRVILPVMSKRYVILVQYIHFTLI